MRRRFPLIAAMLFAMLTLASAQTPRECYQLHSLDRKSLAFKAGERLTFQVHYNWGPVNSDVAKAYLSVDSTVLNGIPCYHAKIFGKTPKFYDMFFRIREDFQSWFSMSSLTPILFKRDTKEGGYYCTNEFWYDWHDRVINAGLYSSKRGTRTVQIPLVNCVYDIPSLIYVLRNIDFNKITDGSTLPLTFAIDDDVYTIRLKRVGVENKKVKGIGTIRSVRFSVGVVAGEVFASDDEKVDMWFSDDDNRILVCFETKVRWGAIDGRLCAYENLNHPFSSLIQ